MRAAVCARTRNSYSVPSVRPGTMTDAPVKVAALVCQLPDPAVRHWTS